MPFMPDGAVAASVKSRRFPSKLHLVPGVSRKVAPGRTTSDAIVVSLFVQSIVARNSILLNQEPGLLNSSGFSPIIKAAFSFPSFSILSKSLLLEAPGRISVTGMRPGKNDGSAPVTSSPALLARILGSRISTFFPAELSITARFASVFKSPDEAS